MRNLVIHQLDNEQMTDILEEMEPDEAADVLSDLIVDPIFQTIV